jgi:hypothetical protein
MIDVKADTNLDVVLTPGNDPDVVTGTDAQKQALRIAVTAYFDAVIGEVDRPTALKKLEVQARRVAAALDFLGALSSIRVAYSDTKPDVAVVELIYTDGETDAIELS